MAERRLTVEQVTELLGVDVEAVHAWQESGLAVRPTALALRDPKGDSE